MERLSHIWWDLKVRHSRGAEGGRPASISKVHLAREANKLVKLIEPGKPLMTLCGLDADTTKLDLAGNEEKSRKGTGGKARLGAGCVVRDAGPRAQSTSSHTRLAASSGGASA